MPTLQSQHTQYSAKYGFGRDYDIGYETTSICFNGCLSLYLDCGTLNNYYYTVTLWGYNLYSAL